MYLQYTLADMKSPYKTFCIDEFKKKCIYIIDAHHTTVFIDGRPQYALKLTCIDNDRNKEYYTVLGIRPYFDIEYNEQTKYLLNNIECIDNIGNVIKKNVYLKPFNYYSEAILHIRVSFSTILEYKKAYEKVFKSEYVRNNENHYSYYNKVIQEYNLISMKKLPKKLLVMTWDIETYSVDKSRIPDGTHKTDTCFLICGTVHEHASYNVIKSFAITTINTTEYIKKDRNLHIRTVSKLIDNKDIIDKILIFAGVIPYLNLTIHNVESEKLLITKFYEVIKDINPDIITGFNDHAYDWQYIKNKVTMYYPDLYECIHKAMNKNTDVNIDKYKPNLFIDGRSKISPDTTVSVTYPSCDFCIFMDTRVEYRKIYPNDNESNLNYYLTKMKLNLKEDMPYKKLFSIYENKDTNGMILAILYCLTDAFRCQELLIKKAIINEYHNMSYLTGITLKNSIHRAIGFKVFNYTLKMGKNYAFKYQIKGDQTKKDYEGGFVADPEYGLNMRCPVIGLDFSSLYPNIQRTLNLGPDTIIRSCDEEKYINSNEVSIRSINNSYVLDHKENEEHKSIMVKILSILFDNRSAIKKLMIQYKNENELHSNINYETVLLMCLNKRFVNRHQSLKAKSLILEFLGVGNLEYVINDLDLKQKAVKILMNSFYGLQGSPTSPLYCKYVAETITLAGREMLTKVRAFVLAKQFLVHYSDTDSVYVSCNTNQFIDIETQYIENKLTIKELFTKKVEITKDKIKTLLQEINEYLVQVYKYNYIKMAYEEVLYPVFFVSKKKYFGIEHINIVNCNYMEQNVRKFLFMRGFSPIKKSATKLNKSIIIDMAIQKLFCKESLHKYHYNNFHLNVCDIIKDVIMTIIDNFKNKKYSIDYFIKTDRYKPSSNNIRVINFVNRLSIFYDGINDPDIKKKYIPPESLERFKYVYVFKPPEVKYNGDIIKTNGLSDSMEYPCYIEDYKADLWYEKYFESELANDLGSLICFNNGKEQVLKAYQLIWSNNNTVSYSFIELIHSTLDPKKTESHKLRKDANKKKTDYNDMLKKLFCAYPIIDKFCLHKCIYEYIHKIDKNYKRTELYSNAHVNKMYMLRQLHKKYSIERGDITCSNILKSSLENKKKEVKEKLQNYLNVYEEDVLNHLEAKLKTLCNEIESSGGDIIKQLDCELIDFIRSKNDLLESIEQYSYYYCNVLYKINLYELYPIFKKRL